MVRNELGDLAGSVGGEIPFPEIVGRMTLGGG